MTMLQGDTTPRRLHTAVLSKVIGRRYVLAWAMSVAGTSLHPALTPGTGTELHVWATSMLLITAGLVSLWLVEPYVFYRHRRRRFRGVLMAESAWTAWRLHLPRVTWAPMRGPRLTGRRPTTRPRQRPAPAPAPPRAVVPVAATCRSELADDPVKPATS